MSSLWTLWTCVGDPHPPSYQQIPIISREEWECSASVRMHSAAMRTEEAVHRCSVPTALMKEGRQTSVQAGESQRKLLLQLDSSLTPLFGTLFLFLLYLARDVCLVTLNITSPRKVLEISWSWVGKWCLTYITLQCVSVSEEWKFGNAQALKPSIQMAVQ